MINFLYLAHQGLLESGALEFFSIFIKGEML